MGEQEEHARMPARELAELPGVRGFLSRVLSPPALPDVMQHRPHALRGEPADRIDERIVGAAAGGGA